MLFWSFFLLVWLMSGGSAGAGMEGSTTEQGGVGKESPCFCDGLVTYRERMALPPDATLIVRLYEAAGQEKPRSLLSELRLPTEGRNVPLPFCVCLPPSAEALASGASGYELEAEITDATGPLFATSSPTALTGGEERKTPLLLMTHRVMSDAGEMAAELTGRRWRLLQLYGQQAEVHDDQPEPHLAFAPENSGRGRVSGSDGCNQLLGEYVMKNDRLRFSGLGSTMRFCAGGAEQAAAFAKALHETDAWRLSGNLLEFFSNGRKVAVFEGIAL